MRHAIHSPHATGLLMVPWLRRTGQGLVMEMYIEAMEVTCRSIFRVVWCISPPLGFTAQAKLKGGCRSMRHQGLGIHSSPVVMAVLYSADR
jgi:hypothetical protein